MDNTLQQLGERWAFLYAATQYAPFTYENGELKFNHEVSLGMDELDAEIAKYQEIASLPDTDQAMIDTLECLNLIKEKIGG